MIRAGMKQNSLYLVFGVTAKTSSFAVREEHGGRGRGEGGGGRGENLAPTKETE